MISYKVYQVFAKSQQSFEALSKLQLTTVVYDFWTQPAMGRPTDIMVPPTHSDEFQQFLKLNGISYSIKLDDVQRYSLISLSVLI